MLIFTATESSRPLPLRRALGGILAGLLLTSSVHAQGRGPSPVVVAPLVEKEVHTGQTFVATVMPEQRAVIGSAVDGRVVEFPIREGDRVEAGQKLAQLLTETISLELAASEGELELRKSELQELQNGNRPEEIEQARAQMEAARADVKLSERRLERIRQLFQRGNAATEDQLDEAQATTDSKKALLEERTAAYQLSRAGARQERVAQAQARVVMQQAVVNRLQDMLTKHTVISRFAGYVAVERTEIGSWVNRGDPVAEIVALDHVDVLAHVLESHVPFIRKGLEARVEVPALPHRVFTGEVILLVPEGDQRSRTFPVKVRLQNEFDDGKPLLNAGMLARVTLPTGEIKRTLLAPKDALVLGGPQPMVYVVDLAPAGGDAPRAGKTRPVPVNLGVASDAWIEITGDLKPGESVVVMGNERLTPGQDVFISSELPPPAPQAAAR